MNNPTQGREDYLNLNGGDFLRAVGMDGKKWAEAFMQLHGDKIPDEGNMLGWFCNSIMAGYDQANRELLTDNTRLKAVNAELVCELKSLVEEYDEISHSVCSKELGHEHYSGRDGTKYAKIVIAKAEATL